VDETGRITIKEIARMCGVSTQTVSRVINKRPDVSPRTREAVEAAIAATGFQPSAVARSLVQRRSQTLGVVVAGLRYFGVAQTLNGITEEAQAAGYGLLLKEIDSSESVDIAPVVEFMIAHRVEGIIFAVPQIGANIATLRSGLSSASPPVVFLKSEPSPAFSTIVIDNFGGARLATRHLLALGRKHVAHVAGPRPWHEAQDREDGWAVTLRDADLAPGPVVAGTWSSESGVAALETILEQDPAVDGVFAANDQMALGVLRAAHQRGIRVPDDIAVVGFDGLDEGAQFTPSLTTVVQPLRELGELAVRELLAPTDTNGSGIRNRVLATELTVRESAPAPGSPARHSASSVVATPATEGSGHGRPR
jgi:LacI family transcriptional regulator